MLRIRQGWLWRGVRQACALAALLFVLSGCGPMIASVPLIGEPPEAQKRPEAQPAYPATFRQPEPDAAKPMSAAERSQAQTDLQTARDQAATERRRQINQRASRPSD
jgi:hypothetical protein